MTRLLSLVSLTGLVLAGCGGMDSGSATTPTAAEYDDVASSVGSTTATSSGGGEVGAMADTVSIAHGSNPLGFSLDANNQIAGTHLGLTYDYTLSCTDGTGQPLSVCDGTTANAMAQIAWSGTLTLPWFAAMVNRTGSWTLTGLDQPSAELNGTGKLTYDATLTAGISSAYHFAFDASYDAVAIDTSSSHAVGGEIDYSIDATHTLTVNGNTSTRDLSIDAHVEFHADETATLTLDGSRTYTIDLTTGAVVSVTGSGSST